MSSIQRASYMSSAVVKGVESPIGLGAKVIGPIPAGEPVGFKGGELMTLAELQASPAFHRHTERQIADDLFIAARKLEDVDASMMYINHSCEPNVGPRGLNGAFALRDLEPGEFLYADYGVYFSYPGFELQCLCGTASCRGTITNRDWLLPELSERYGDYFAQYLWDKLQGLDEQDERRSA